MTSIGICIGIGNTGPVFTRYWIDTKIYSIAHPYLHFLKLLTHNYWRTLLSPTGPRVWKSRQWTRHCEPRESGLKTLSPQNAFIIICCVYIVFTIYTVILSKCLLYKIHRVASVMIFLEGSTLRWDLKPGITLMAWVRVRFMFICFG